MSFVTCCHLRGMASWRLGAGLRGARWHSTGTQKQHYFTTPIFYVNARPHIGHLHSMVLADCLSRWQRFNGQPTVLATGTDEHGIKVANAAAAHSMAPQAFTDTVSRSFADLAQAANIDYFRFIRTTDADHVRKCQDVWTRLLASGNIYQGNHQGWYSVSDETFYPESELIRRDDGTLVSKDSGTSVEWQQESNYFFRLSAFRDRLIEHFRKHLDFVVPQARHEALLAGLENAELPDLSISRPVERCSWGVPVPGDPSQIMYVWFDALLNYLTVADAATAATGLETWPADAHIIGKDIVRFHCIYWPAFLTAANLSPPKSVVVHNHWTMDGFKMSKSRKNVVDPFAAIDDYGIDAVRYFLMHDGSLEHDTPFSYERLVERYNVNLVNKLGNLLSRVCGPKFDIAGAVSASSSSEAAPATAGELEQTLATLLPSARALMQDSEVQKLLVLLNKVAMLANQYFQDAEPWAAPPEKQAEVVRLTAEACRLVSLILLPFCPSTASRLLDRLNVSRDNRTADFAVLGADKAYGQGANRKGDPVFQKLALK